MIKIISLVVKSHYLLLSFFEDLHTYFPIAVGFWTWFQPGPFYWVIE